MIGVKPRSPAARWATAPTPTSTSSWSRPTARPWRRKGLRYELLRVETSLSMVPRQRPLEVRAGQAHAARRRRHARCRRRQAGASVAAGELGPLPARSLDRRRQRRRHLAHLRRRLYAEASADTPDLLEIALDKPDYRPGDTHERRGDRAHRRPPHAQRVQRPAGRQHRAGRQDRHRACDAAGRHRLGHRRLCGGDAAPSARRAGAAHARPRHRRAMVRASTAPRTRCRCRSICRRCCGRTPS